MDIDNNAVKAWGATGARWIGVKVKRKGMKDSYKNLNNRNKFLRN